MAEKNRQFYISTDGQEIVYNVMNSLSYILGDSAHQEEISSRTLFSDSQENILIKRSRSQRSREMIYFQNLAL